MAKKVMFRRFLMFIFSLLFMGIGVAFTKHSNLGVSPISSVANVLSLRFTLLSIGVWITITSCVLVLGQIIVLQKNFPIKQLLQIPLSFLFGICTDFGLWLICYIPNDQYIVQLLLLICGVVLLGLGIVLGIFADVMMNSGEAFVKVISDTTKIGFGYIKIAFDVLWVLFAVCLSLLFFNGKIYGVREGTIISAILVGIIVKAFQTILKKPLTCFLSK